MNAHRHFRASHRPHVACNVRLRFCEKEPTELLCYTRDIGEGGLFAVTQSALTEGSIVDVIIEAPSLWQPVVLQAMVAWKSKEPDDDNRGYGLKFTALEESKRLALSELLCALDFEA
ncbi:MAG: PilZ domain-containing protein [Myxococcota bacterium]|jgi:hypothetical protein|nr:PilZ domain-containing protein [Myxococcota bacterium]